MPMFMLATLLAYLRLASFLWDTVKLNTQPWERGHGAHIDSGNMVMLKLDHISVRHGVYTLGKSMRDASGLLLHVVVRFLQIPWVDGWRTTLKLATIEEGQERVRYLRMTDDELVYYTSIKQVIYFLHFKISVTDLSRFICI
jgi:hypothetical protein